MKRLAPAARLAVWAEPIQLPSLGPLQLLLSFLTKTLVIAELEIRKLRHDPSELLTRAVQPALWMLVFGSVFSSVHAIPTGSLPYIDFMAPGILAQSALFVSIFYGLTIIWERDLGIVHKFLSSPTPRGALVLGKALSAGVRSVAQAALIYVLALVMGVHMNWDVLSILGVALIVILGAAFFATLSLIIACLVKTRERFMGIGQVITMPLFFASNAIYPVSIMPAWLQVVSRINPLTYEVDALRGLMISGGQIVYGFGVDFLVLALATTVMVILASWLYPRVVV